MLNRERALDAMTIEVEVAPDAALSDSERARKASELSQHIKSLIGITCKIALKSPGEVPRSQGKAVRVKDERNK